MSEMVERVTEAILAKLPSALQYGSAGVAARILAKGPARAAIEAMREPSEAMIRAGWERSPWDSSPSYEGLGKAFTAMIDAALKEPE